MADRYWVGGTANWDVTAGTKWATTSGGAGGAAVPTSADNVFFDANSGAGTVTVTDTAYVNNLNFTGYTGILSGNAGLSIYGNFTVSAGMTWGHIGPLNFEGATVGRTITTNGKSLANNSANFTGGAGSWILQDNINLSAVFLNSGTLDTNGKTVDVSSLYLYGGTLTCGASTVNLLYLANFGTTINAGTSTFRFDLSGATLSVVLNFTAAVTFYNVEIYGKSADILITSATTFNNLKIAPLTTWSVLKLEANIIVNGTFTSTGTSVQQRNLICSSVRNTQRAINAAAVSVQDTDFRDINANGAAVPWGLTGQRVGDLGNNSDINFPTPVTRYAVAAGNWSSTAVWSATSGGAVGASVPLPQDTAIFDASTGPGTYTLNVYRIGGIDASACGARVLAISIPTPPPGFSGFQVYKSFILSSALTFTPNSNNITFTGGGANTINTANKQLYDISIAGNYTLASSLSVAASISVNGLFVTNGYNVTCGSTVIAVAVSIWDNATLYMGSSVWRLTDSGTCWNYLSGTIFAESSTIEIAASAASTYTFAGGGQTYYGLLVTGSTGASVVSIGGSNTFNTISSTKSNAYTLRFTNGQTTTVSTWSVSGSSGNVVTIDSTSAGSRFNLTKTGGGLTVSNFVSVKDSNASPANTFYAVNSTNAGNNVNWTFNFPSSQGNLLAFC